MYKPKTCPLCGDVFTVKSARQKYCNKLVIRNCMICGKEYESKCNPTYNKCCSKKCQTIYTHQQQVAGYSDKRAICKLCGKEFTPVNNTQVVCNNAHYLTCEVCGKEFLFEFKQSADIPKTCSRECATKLSFKDGNPAKRPEVKEKARQTMQERYGVDHPMHSEEIKKKLDNTMIERYGVRRYAQTPEYVQQAKATNQQKYGVDWPIQSDVFKEKSKNTLFEHFGVYSTMHSPEIVEKRNALYKEKTGYENPLQNPEVREKGKQKLLELYGVDHPSKSSQIKAKAIATMEERYGATGVLNSPILSEKVKNTNKQRYGYENAASSPIVQQKIADTMTRKYGVPHYTSDPDYRSTLMTDPSKLDNWLSFLDNPESFISSHFNESPTYGELKDVLGVNPTTIQSHLSRNNKLHLIKRAFSYYEDELIKMLTSINPTMKIERRNREIIKPYEIDIYLPEYNIGIEMNPTGTHNSSFPYIEKEIATPPSYHRMKTDLCEKQGVFLFHIFGYEWEHRKPIIESMLRNLLHCNTSKIYARKCELKEVPAKEAYDFLQNNHRQGGVHSKYRYGLYYDNELVSLMTFGKLRNTLGNGTNVEDCWELVRFCNKLNTSVIGGASKLFKHFIKAVNPKEIRSFSDRAHTKGSLYPNLGFKYKNKSNASYVWVDIHTNKAYSRICAQKHNLHTFFKDSTIDLSKTEREIMESHGYARVYDSGTITWQWLAK